jgi:GntR family transcriptional regulator / MocR family aminotransferase
VPRSKIQLKGQFALDRHRGEPLSLQIAHQLQDAIEGGRIARGTRLPSSRTLARTLGVSRNTVIAAYDELSARGLVRSRRGAGIYAHAPAVVSGFNVKAVMRAAQFPSRTISLRDQDGNPLCITY